MKSHKTKSRVIIQPIAEDIDNPLNESKLEEHQLYMYPSAGKRAREQQ